LLSALGIGEQENFVLDDRPASIRSKLFPLKEESEPADEAGSGAAP